MKTLYCIRCVFFCHIIKTIFFYSKDGNLNFSSHEDGELKIELVDLAGKIVYTHVSAFTNVERLDLSEVHNRMYVVKISIDGNEVAVENLVIKK